MAHQLALPIDTPVEVAAPRTGAETTFIDNMRLPVHRWFRYSAGFSGAWAESVIRDVGAGARVLDPFAGSGTTLLAADSVGAASIGAEPHPFVVRVARAKLLWYADPDALLTRAARIIERAQGIAPKLDEYPSIVRRSFTDEALSGLHQLRIAWDESRDGSPASDLTWLALAAVLRPVSHVGTAPWQYLLPAKRKRNPAEPFTAFKSQVRLMASDMLAFRANAAASSTVLDDDARTLNGVASASIDLVVTSPPYANNYDYADATRLEMSFFREIDGWSDLQQTVRERLIRSCSQHVNEGAVDLDSVLDDPILVPIARELGGACRTLADLRLTKGGRKNYHLMAAAYFLDLAHVWRALRRVCKAGSRVCFVIGDSAPYGVHLPVIRWFEALASAAGFGASRFEKTRDRNVKWRNRKHRVPLVEGHLWIEG